MVPESKFTTQRFCEKTEAKIFFLNIKLHSLLYTERIQFFKRGQVERECQNGVKDISECPSFQMETRKQKCLLDSNL